MPYRKEIMRQDLEKIIELIPPKARVLDLGCGDGSLLSILRQEKEVKGTGMEFDQNKIIGCVERGVPVVHFNLNDGLSQFRDKAFDFVILSQTLQSVQRPDLLLEEMVRVGEKAVISIINMGYYQLRFQLLFKGRMPRTETLPYHWYNTPNTHLSTIIDFQELCNMLKIKIIKKFPLNDKKSLFARFWPNMFASTCVFTVAEN